MASLGHIAVGLGAGRWWSPAGPGRAMLALCALSMLPDIDVVGMALGVPYGAPWGHRGATHSLAIAVAASHGLLDAMTDGGRGVALLWPLTTHRYFLPWRPIPVAPIGVGFLSVEGLEVAAWELVVFLPLIGYALWPRHAR